MADHNDARERIGAIVDIAFFELLSGAIKITRGQYSCSIALCRKQRPNLGQYNKIERFGPFKPVKRRARIGTARKVQHDLRRCRAGGMIHRLPDNRICCGKPASANLAAAAFR